MAHERSMALFEMEHVVIYSDHDQASFFGFGQILIAIFNFIISVGRLMGEIGRPTKVIDWI